MKINLLIARRKTTWRIWNAPWPKASSPGNSATRVHFFNYNFVIRIRCHGVWSRWAGVFSVGYRRRAVRQQRISNGSLLAYIAVSRRGNHASLSPSFCGRRLTVQMVETLWVPGSANPSHLRGIFMKDGESRSSLHALEINWGEERSSFKQWYNQGIVTMFRCGAAA